MSDLISKQAAIEDVKSWVAVDEREKQLQKDVIEWLKEFPSAQTKSEERMPETNCSEIPNGSDDTISRQMALDAFGLSEKTRKYGGDHSGYDTRMLYEIQDTLENLPAVQPDHNADIGKKAEGDCISRQAVVKFFNDWISCLDENCHHQSVADMIIIKNDFKNLPSVQPEPHWIPCSERLPEEEHWLGGSGKQFSENVLVSVLNSADEDEWVDVSHTIDGEWALELPSYCKIIAWMPLPEPWKGE